MSKTKISLYDADPGNNTDIDGINLAEGMAPGLVNNAIRELMAQLKDFQVGSAGDPLTVGGNLAVTGTSAFIGDVAVTGNFTVGGEPLGFPVGTKMLFQQSTAPTGWTKDTTHDNKALRVVTGSVSSGGSVNFSTAFASKAVTGTIANTTAGGTVGGTSLSTAQIPSHNHSISGSGTTSAVSNDHVHAVNINSGNQSANHAHTLNINTNTAGAHNHTVRLASNFGGGSATQATESGFARDPQDYFNYTTSSHAGHVHNVSGTTANNNANHFHTVSGNTGGISANHTHTFSFSGSSGNSGSGSSHTHTFTGSSHGHTFTGSAIDLAVQYVDLIIATKN